MEDVFIGKFGYIKRQTLEWFSSHLTFLSLGIIGVVLLLVGSARLAGWFQGNNPIDYIVADLAYQKWEGGGPSSPQLLRLNTLLQRHPELHTKYDAAIAQRLLNAGEGKQAEPYASSTFKRTEGCSPYHAIFAQGSLMIGRGELAGALESAKRLRQQMEADHLFWEAGNHILRHGASLFAYNLLRIATLEKIVGSPEGELSAWRALKQHTGKEQPSTLYDAEASESIHQNFQRKGISLLDYIDHREKSITSSASSR